MKEWEEVESMDIFWGEALGSEEGNKYRTEYSEVMMHTGESILLSKCSYVSWTCNLSYAL